MHGAPQTEYVAAEDGVRIAYQVVGDGPVDLVYARPGVIPVDLAWDEPSSRRFLEALCSFTRLVMYDSRGFGASGGGTGQRAPTLETWVDDVRLVMDAVGMRRAALLGWSEGAAYCLFLGATDPSRVSALVLVNAFARFLYAEDYPAGVRADVLDRLSDAVFEQYGRGVMADLLVPTSAHDPTFRAWIARCERLAASPETMKAYWRDLIGRDFRPLLAAVRSPTLVLHRRGDRYVTADHGRYLARHISSASHVELDGEDHLPVGAHANEYVEEIQAFLTGNRTPAPPDRVLATVLFTDIVGSTAHLTELGDRRWRDLLDDHDDVVRSALQLNGGREIKTTGDGFLATFEGPARAIRGAHAIRSGAQTLGLDVRIGIHAGEVQLRGDDIAGVAVHIAQRISNLATPGEIMVSRTVVDLVAGADLKFEDRGEHSLRGVPGEWRLFAVRA